MRHLLVVVCVSTLGACSVSNPGVPALAGPSELAVALSITASPDHIPQDGASQSVITVLARDAAGQPVRGLSLHADLFVNGIHADFGTLSSRSVSTAHDGRASIAYMAPGPPPATAGNDNTVTIYMTPVGTDVGSSLARGVSIRLMRPGVILPPNGTPIPLFFFSPQQPHENDLVQFDATGSSDDGQIVSDAWSFGDGTSGTGPKVLHSYAVAGTYNVTLTVTDDRGLTASTAPIALNVTAAIDPTASFVLSPTNPAVGNRVTVNAAASTVPPGRVIVAYEWDFGDGSTGSGPTASHVYTQAKTFTVVLTLTDSTGRTNSTSKTITVGP